MNLSLHTPEQGLGAGPDLEFLVDFSDMRSDRFNADKQLSSDFFIEEAFGEIGKYFLFPGCKV